MTAIENLAEYSNRREQHAKRIRELMEDSANSIVALGRELFEAREEFPRGPHSSRPGWAEWLRAEFNMGSHHAKKLMRISEHFGELGKFKDVPSAPIDVLTILSSDITKSARDEITRRLKAGEKIGARTARKIVKGHLPTPSKARKEAEETGKPVEATDGFVYFGATKEQEKQIEVRRNVVYGVHRAIETLAAVPMSPHDFLKYALPHQLWTKKEEYVIDQAAEWLWALNVAWGRRK